MARGAVHGRGDGAEGVAGRKLLAAGVAAASVVTAALHGRAFGAGRYGGGEGPLNVAGLNRALPLVKKWTALFPKVTPLMALTVMRLESNFDPSAKNLSERAVKGGGAWGQMMLLFTTAEGVAKELAKDKRPYVVETLKKWTGKADSLLDPDLNTLFGVYYLAKLAGSFANFDMVMAAYQSGPAPVKRALAEGKRYDTYLGPHGKAYVAMADDFRKKLQEYA